MNDNCAIRNLAVLNLDAETTVSSPSAATKDAPFVNTLGMKFVPVPITGGPTNGQRGSPQDTGQPLVPGTATSVLFSVWETRVQDYEVFARETKREWPKPEFEQGPTHPAVNVSWDDATAFCAWLTERERTAGKLGANELYRLPSDHEWSCAVELGPREDPLERPHDKDGKLGGIYPWGTEWPPSQGAGNYLSEEFRPLLATGRYRDAVKAEPPARVDGWAVTAPVATYAANLFGLYDVGGNASEWCHDVFSTDRRRVLRGGSWAHSSAVSLASSKRLFYDPQIRQRTFGFRLVLAPAPAAAP